MLEIDDQKITCKGKGVIKDLVILKDLSGNELPLNCRIIVLHLIYRRDTQVVN